MFGLAPLYWLRVVLTYRPFIQPLISDIIGSRSALALTRSSPRSSRGYAAAISPLPEDMPPAPACNSRSYNCSYCRTVSQI